MSDASLIGVVMISAQSAEMAALAKAADAVAAVCQNTRFYLLNQQVRRMEADLVTFAPVRQKLVGPVETCVASKGACQPRNVTTDDAAIIVRHYEGGGRGVMSISQISMRHQNAMGWDIAAWQAQNADKLRIGHRDAPNQILQRDPGLLNAAAAAASSLPDDPTEMLLCDAVQQCSKSGGWGRSGRCVKR